MTLELNVQTVHFLSKAVGLDSSITMEFSCILSMYIHIMYTKKLDEHEKMFAWFQTRSLARVLIDGTFMQTYFWHESIWNNLLQKLHWIKKLHFMLFLKSWVFCQFCSLEQNISGSSSLYCILVLSSLFHRNHTRILKKGSSRLGGYFTVLQKNIIEKIKLLNCHRKGLWHKSNEAFKMSIHENFQNIRLHFKEWTFGLYSNSFLFNKIAQCWTIAEIDRRSISLATVRNHCKQPCFCRTWWYFRTHRFRYYQKFGSWKGMFLC